jgi:hypothetical protein
MTKKQAIELGHALIFWGNGERLEARDALNPESTWGPFRPENYEKLNVDEGIEWRVVETAPSGKQTSK